MTRRKAGSDSSSPAGPSASPRSGGAAKLAPWQIRIAQDEITLQLRGGLRIGDVAARLSLSSTHFSKAFKNSVGLAPYRWYQRARIAKSMQLLREGGLALSAIAAECGFFDESHYITAFSRVVGMPPGRWRRKHATESGAEMHLLEPVPSAPLRVP